MTDKCITVIQNHLIIRVLQNVDENLTSTAALDPHHLKVKVTH